MAQTTKYDFYDFEKFEPKLVSNRTEAPEIKAVPKKKEELKLVKKKRPSKKQIIEERNEAFRKTTKITLVAILCLAFFALAIYSRVELDEVNREISKVDSQMAVVQSETTRLQSELNAMVSMDKVEDYAYNTLGMVKIQDYQVVYMDLSADDKIVLADGKNTENGNLQKEVINETEK